MGNVLRLRFTEAQQTLARFRDEERSFALVLGVLKEARKDDLFRRMFNVYRSRMRHLRKLAGSLLDGVESRPTEDRSFGPERERDP